MSVGISVGTSSSLIKRPISPVTFGPHIMYLTIVTICVVAISIVICIAVKIWPVVTGVIRPIGLMLCVIWTVVLVIMIVRPIIVIIAVIWLVGRIVICSIMRLVSRVIRIVPAVIIRTVVIVVILVAVLKIFVFAPVVPLSASTVITLPFVIF